MNQVLNEQIKIGQMENECALAKKTEMKQKDFVWCWLYKQMEIGTIPISKMLIVQYQKSEAKL